MLEGSEHISGSMFSLPDAPWTRSLRARIIGRYTKTTDAKQR